MAFYQASGSGSSGVTTNIDAGARATATQAIAATDALKATDFASASQKAGAGNESILEITRSDGSKYDVDIGFLPTASDGKMHFVPRTDSSLSQPTAAEVANPNDGDTAIIRLIDGTSRYSKYYGGWLNVPMPTAETENILIAESGDVVPVNQQKFIDGQLWSNNTAAAIPVPVDKSQASLEAVGLTLANSPVEPKTDAGEMWQESTAYKAGESFTYTVTQSTAVDVNGDAIEQDKLKSFAYKVGQTSKVGTPTLAEIALWEEVGKASSSGASISPNSQAEVTAGTVVADKYVQPDTLKVSIDTEKNRAVTAESMLIAEVNKKQDFADLVVAIRDTATAEDTKYPSEKAVRSLFESLSFTGFYKGSSDTFAGLIAGSDSDWAILNTLDGVNKRGIYVTDGTDYTLAIELEDFIALIDAQAQSATDDAMGLVSGKLLYDREQALKGAGTDVVLGTDSIAKSWDAKQLSDAIKAVKPFDLIKDVRDIATSTHIVVPSEKAVITYVAEELAGVPVTIQVTSPSIGATQTAIVTIENKWTKAKIDLTAGKSIDSFTAVNCEVVVVDPITGSYLIQATGGIPTLVFTEKDIISVAGATEITALVGTFVWRSREDKTNHVFGINGQRITGGVGLYPTWVAQLQADFAAGVLAVDWIQGADIVLPNWQDGRSIRNSGGRASPIGDTQPFSTARPNSGFTGSTNTKSHTHSIQRYNNATGAVAGGTVPINFDSNSQYGGATSSNSHNHSVTITGGGDSETVGYNMTLLQCVIATA